MTEEKTLGTPTKRKKKQASDSNNGTPRRVSPRKNKGNRMSLKLRAKKKSEGKASIEFGKDFQRNEHQLQQQWEKELEATEEERISPDMTTPSKENTSYEWVQPPVPNSDITYGPSSSNSLDQFTAGSLDVTSSAGIAQMLKMATQATISPNSRIIHTPSSVGSKMTSPISSLSENKVRIPPNADS